MQTTIRALQIRRRKFKPNEEKAQALVKRKTGEFISKENIRGIWEEEKQRIIDALFETGEIEIGVGIGKLSIYKIEISHARQKLITCMKRAGFHYFIAWNRPEIMSKKIRFRPSKALLVRLRQEIENRDYKPAPLKYYKNKK